MNAPETLNPPPPATAQIVPSKLAHYVIRAKRFQEMLAWYRKVFHLKTSFEAPVIAFLTYDEEHHRIAFLNTAHLPSPDTMRTGVDHVAFTYASLGDLLHTWERLKTLGITPFWCINHGLSTSMYYRDPDGNEIELQVDNFPTMDECRAWFASEPFAANPIGVDFDPAVLLDRLRGGAAESELLRQGAAPVPKERQYVFTTLPPPPAAADTAAAVARSACETLSLAYGHHADAWEAEALANLFAVDGVFDRLGRRIEGREAIRAFIAGRPRDGWQHHIGSGFSFELSPDGRSAKGTLELELQRGKPGSSAVVETLRCRYHDDFVLTAEGWRFQLRRVVMIE